MRKTETVSTAGNEFTEYITSNIESSSDPNDHYADLADITRTAMGRIKTGVYNNQVMQRKRFHNFPSAICDKKLQCEPGVHLTAHSVITAFIESVMVH